MQKKFITLIAICSTLLMAVTSFGATTIKMSYNGPPNLNHNAVHAYATTFKELVEKKTDGQLLIELYPNSQLGNEQQRMEQVMSGPMINIASYGGIETVFPEMFATNIPFLFNSYEAAHRFFDNSQFMVKARKELLNRTGVELLAVVEEGGFLAFTSNKPVHSPKSFKGMKFRAMDASQVAMYEAFGASGTPISWTEVYIALKTGVADGQMNPPTYIIIGSLYEVQKHLTLANVQYSDQFLLINEALMKKLSAKQQEAIRKAAKTANDKTREFVESQVEKRIGFLAKKGMTVYRPTKEEIQEFKDLGAPSYVKWLQKKIDQSWIDLAAQCTEMANNK